MEILDSPTYHITSVDKFIQLIDSMLYISEDNPYKYIFRGESNFKNRLIPSIGRLYGKHPFEDKIQLERFEISAFHEFRISAYHDLREYDEFILLAIAQHHGLKTRLLDWTFSALIALFFAVENENGFYTDGSLIALQADFGFNKHMQNSKSPFDLKVDYDFIFVPSLSPRIKAQQGVFQIFKDPTKELQNTGMRKFCIPKNQKQKIKYDLEVLGISYKTIFPDLDGLCKSINYWKLRNV